MNTSGLWFIAIAAAIFCIYLAVVFDEDHAPGVYAFGVVLFVLGLVTAVALGLHLP